MEPIFESKGYVSELQSLKNYEINPDVLLK